MEAKLEFNIQEKGGIVKITLEGQLDATNANSLLEELKKLTDKNIKEMVFFVKNLEYIASAGVRTLIFSKQKIGKNADIYLIAPQDEVLEVMKMVGLNNFLIIQDEYNE